MVDFAVWEDQARAAEQEATEEDEDGASEAAVNEAMAGAKADEENFLPATRSLMADLDRELSPEERGERMARLREQYIASRMESSRHLEETSVRLREMVIRRAPEMSDRVLIQAMDHVHRAKSDDEMSLVLGQPQKGAGGINILAQNIVRNEDRTPPAGRVGAETISSNVRVGLDGGVTTPVKDMDMLSDTLQTISSQLRDDETARRIVGDARAEVAAKEVVEAEVVPESEEE